MPVQPLGPTGLLAQSMTLPAGSQSMAMGGMRMQAQGMDGRKKRTGVTVDYIMIGGGGAGGGGQTADSGKGGGGGGGGIVFGSITLLPGSYQIVVGAIVAGAAIGQQGANGNPSSAFGVVALGGGGGGGGDGPTAGRNGASGGGGSRGTAGGAGVAGQGFAGASSLGGTDSAGGGGGGGAGQRAADDAPGGVGKTFLFFDGTNLTLSAGGRGGKDGQGGALSAIAGGGGGGGGGGFAGGGGKSGIVWVRYATGAANCTGGAVAIYGAYTVHGFNASDTFTVA